MGVLVLVVLLLWLPLPALANCVALDMVAWTSAQRGLLMHLVAVSVNESVTKAPPKHSTPNLVEICAPTADLTSLSSPTLQAAAQALLATQAATEVARQAAWETARTRVRTNNLCTASFAEVENRLDAIDSAIQTDIDAINDANTIGQIKVALTTALMTEKARRTAIDKQLAECILGRGTLQGGN